MTKKGMIRMYTEDPRRLAVAAHELGHAIAWERANVTPTEIRVIGRGDGCHGFVNIERHLIVDVDDARAYLAGLAAGREAGRRWCEANDLAHHEHTCRTDMANLRQQHRTPLGRQVTRTEVRDLAARIVRTEWRRIVRLAPKLARAGHITL